MARTYIMHVFTLVVFLFAHHVTPDQLFSNSNWTICDSRDQRGCNCSSNVMTNVIFKCQITKLSYLESFVNSSEDIKMLDISGNNIQRLPSGSFRCFSNLIYLSMASNDIQIISEGAFDGLTNLLEIDLSDNQITSWNTTGLDKHLPSLRFLNVELNPYWIPDNGILSLQNLQGITVLFLKVYASPYILRCYLVKNSGEISNKSEPFDPTLLAMPEDHTTTLIKTKNPNETLNELAQHMCSSPKLVFQNSSFLDIIGSHGFGIQYELMSGYKGPLRTRLYNSTMKWKAYILYVETCWNDIALVQIVTSFAAILALVSNMVVITTTLRSRVLRESVAHVLVANIASGDLLVSIYILILVSTRQSVSKSDFYAFFGTYYCRVVGFLFLAGQTSTSLLSFLMTLERYLAVVYCMRPHIRITMTTCRVAMVTIWTLCLSLSVSFMTSNQFSRKTDSMCVPKSNINHLHVLTLVGGIGVFLYILSIALYGHMYVDFKRTNQKTVQLQRENRLARRIAPIVFTNLFFFILPLFITTAAKRSFLANYLTNRDKSILWSTLAVTCLGINSFLNPVLFSFRNEKFRNECRRRVLPCDNSIDTI